MTQPAYLPSLTPLRGIAAIGIVLHHFTAFFLPSTGDVLAPHSGLLKNGFLLVDFFFILSGFTLMHLYGARLQGSDFRRQFGLFLGARLARLYPLHIATLAVLLLLAMAQLAAQIHNQGLESYLAGTWWKWGHGDLRDMLLNIFLLQSLPLYTAWNGPAWSISADWFAYLLFPIFLLPARRWPRLNQWLCAPLVLLLLAWIEWRYATLDVAGPVSIVRCFLEVWFGITLYTVFSATRGLFPWGHNGLLLLAATLAVAVMHFNAFQTLAIVPLGIVIAASVANASWPARVLNGRCGVLLGKISFSIYMTHWVLMSWVEWLWKGVTKHDIQASFSLGASWGVLAVAVLVVLLVSYPTYRYLEVPWRDKLRRRFALS